MQKDIDVRETHFPGILVGNPALRCGGYILQDALSEGSHEDLLLLQASTESKRREELPDRLIYRIELRYIGVGNSCCDRLPDGREQEHEMGDEKLEEMIEIELPAEQSS